MSGENIYNLVGAVEAQAQAQAQQEAPQSAYTGKYEKRLEEREKPTYSTFYHKGKEFDGTNVRFFKQRDAIIGKSVADSVYPDNYLKRGGGVRNNVPTIHKEKIYRNPPVDHGKFPEGSPFGADMGNGASNGNPNSNGLDGGNGNNSGGLDGAAAYGYPGGNNDWDGVGNAGYDDRRGPPLDGRKNFIASNIVEMSNMVPKRRVDQPCYATDRKDFGKTPAYLSRVKGELEAEKSFVKAVESKKETRQQEVYSRYVYRLDPKKQQELIARLQQKLDGKLSAMSKMSLAPLSGAAQRKRGELEKSIRDLEVALQKLKKEAIFIYRDDPVNGQWCKNAAMEEARAFAATQ